MTRRIAIIAVGSTLVAGVALAATGQGNDNPAKRLTTAGTGTPLYSPGRNREYTCILGLNFQKQVTKPSRKWIIPAPTSVSGIIVMGKKVYVNGMVKWHSQLKITLTRYRRIFVGNGLPSTPTGVFPIRQGTAAYSYYKGAPALGYKDAAAIPIKPWNLAVSLPRYPKIARTRSCLGPKITTGIALSGATYHIELAGYNQKSLIDPKSPVGDPNAVFPLDRCFGHPYAAQYHYHGPSWACFSSIPSLRKALDNPHQQSPLLGYAIDGFGIYGPRGPGGRMLTNKDLDECHGMVSRVWWDRRYVRMYHYVLTAQFPYSIGCFRGTPVKLPPQFS